MNPLCRKQRIGLKGTLLAAMLTLTVLLALVKALRIQRLPFASLASSPSSSTGTPSMR